MKRKSVRLTDAQYAALKRAADFYGVTESVMLRRLVQDLVGAPIYRVGRVTA